MTRPVPRPPQRPTPRPAPPAAAPAPQPGPPAGPPAARPSQTPATGDVPPDPTQPDPTMGGTAGDGAPAATPPAPARLSPTQQATANDDWAKQASWDVTDASGQPVTDLDTLAEVLGVDRATAAGALLNSPLGAAAPQELQSEAQEEVNPSGGSLYGEFDDAMPDDTQDTGFDDQEDDVDAGIDDAEEGDPEDAVDAGADEDTEDESDDSQPAGKALPRAGTLVAWGGGKLRGRVELMVTNGGTVPGITDGVVGTKALPVARVRLYEQTGKSWTATSQRVAVDARVLRPLGQAQPTPPARDISARMVLKVAQHAGPAGSGKPTAETMREVYRRGRASWPGERKTLLSADEWALGRVEAFVAKAEGYDVEHYVGDDDLLP